MKMDKLRLYGEHVFYSTHVGFVNQGGMSKVPLALRRFLSEDMAFISVFSFHFSGAGKLKAFFGAGICFHFWHDR